MTVVTTRPNATVSSSGMTPSAGTRHGCTSDDSDTTYITAAAAGSVELGFAEPSIPAGGLVKSLAARLRTKKNGPGNGVVSFAVYPAGVLVDKLAGGSVTPTWAAITTTTIMPATAYALTPSDLVLLLATNASGSDVTVYEAWIDTTYVAKPVATPSTPTGTITDTNIPTVEWANTLDADGGAATHYQVRVFSAAQYGAGGFNAASSAATWDSGDVSSGFHYATSAAITTPLPNATYRAYVRVGQTVGGVTHWSDYAYTGFVISITPPADPDAPTLTVQTGRIKVHVEGNSGAVTTTHLEVQRSEDGGTTYEPLRLTTDTDGLITGTSADVYDYEAPNGTLMTYRVRALHEAGGYYITSAWVSATATWSTDSWWLKCPESPSLNMVVVPASLPGYQRPARQGVFQALGSSETVIVADKRGNPRGTLRLQIDTPAEQDDLDALLDANLTLLLQGPAAHHFTDRYVRFGDQDRQRWIDKAWIGEHLDTLQWWEVTRPAGVVDSWPA